MLCSSEANLQLFNAAVVEVMNWAHEDHVENERSGPAGERQPNDDERVEHWFVRFFVGGLPDILALARHTAQPRPLIFGMFRTNLGRFGINFGMFLSDLRTLLSHFGMYVSHLGTSRSNFWMSVS